jgi:hypothetical protein
MSFPARGPTQLEPYRPKPEADYTPLCSAVAKSLWVFISILSLLLASVCYFIIIRLNVFQYSWFYVLYVFSILCSLCFCIVLYVVSPLAYSCLSPIFVQVYWPLPPGGNKIAVNKCHVMSCHISYHITSRHVISYATEQRFPKLFCSRLTNSKYFHSTSHTRIACKLGSN